MKDDEDKTCLDCEHYRPSNLIMNDYTIHRCIFFHMHLSEEQTKRIIGKTWYCDGFVDVNSSL